jgi:hypothetical protein
LVESKYKLKIKKIIIVPKKNNKIDLRQHLWKVIMRRIQDIKIPLPSPLKRGKPG